MRRHVRNHYYVVGEGMLGTDGLGPSVALPPSQEEELREFRFSRLGPKGPRTDQATRTALATAMTGPAAQPDSAAPAIPSGFTYLGQFVDHDLTMDRTATALGEDVTVAELVQGRSPALDLDSLYGRGPDHPQDKDFYNADRMHLRVGSTAGVGSDPQTSIDHPGFDLPRNASASTPAGRRLPLIPDLRNDENLVIAQTHLALIRFHNRVVDETVVRGGHAHAVFAAARSEVVRHYQWMLRTDFLPRIVDPAIVTDVFENGRRVVDPPHQHGHHRPERRAGERPAMPIEFAIAAYRLGHSMVRGAYQWNKVFNSTAPARIATLLQLFTFTGTSGNFTPHPATTPVDDVLADLDNLASPAGGLERLPSNWIPDFRRLYDFTEAGRADLAAPAASGGGNIAKRIDTLIVDPLAHLPLGAFDGRGTQPQPVERNLAFRNLTRASMVELGTGQQLAELVGVAPLTPAQVLTGAGGADLSALTDDQRGILGTATPLWFYILREAELNNGRLTGVGGRIVAEVFHRAMEASRISIVRDPGWRPSLGPSRGVFRMVDLMLFAYEGKLELLNPLGDAVPAPAPPPVPTPSPAPVPAPTSESVPAADPAGPVRP
jgi:hypothetical protein